MTRLEPEDQSPAEVSNRQEGTDDALAEEIPNVISRVLAESEALNLYIAALSLVIGSAIGWLMPAFEAPRLVGMLLGAAAGLLVGALIGGALVYLEIKRGLEEAQRP